MKTEMIALIPAYKPDEALIRIVRETRESGLRPVVVDDGSGPDFREVFAGAADEGAVVLSYEENHGKGAALKYGLSWIGRRFAGPCSVVTVDADGQHRVEDALVLAQSAALRPLTLFLGSRTLPADAPLRSRVGNAFARLIFRLSTGKKVLDTQTGLRAFSGEMIPRMVKIPGDRYEYEMNVLMETARGGGEICEMEIPALYEEGNPSSHFRTVADTARILKEVAKFSASSLISAGADLLLFLMFSALLSGAALGVAAANVLARLISASLNFTLNRRLVFEGRGELGRSALSYALVAALILAGNTVVVTLLTGPLGLPLLPAKILTELLLFTVSWLLQRRFVFPPVRIGGNAYET